MLRHVGGASCFIAQYLGVGPQEEIAGPRPYAKPQGYANVQIQICLASEDSVAAIQMAGRSAFLDVLIADPQIKPAQT